MINCSGQQVKINGKCIDRCKNDEDCGVNISCNVELGLCLWRTNNYGICVCKPDYVLRKIYKQMLKW